MPKTLRLVYSGAALLLAACQTTAPRDTATLRHIDATLHPGTAAAAPAAPPPEVNAALLPPLKVEVANAGAAVEQRFDITVNHAQAREFFMSLVEGTPYNMVVHPEVSGEISLTLKNVTIGEVMDAVRDVYGYEYQHTASGYEVMPIRMQSRVFEVNYLDVKRTGKSETRVNSGQVSDANNNSNTNNTSGTTSGGTSGTVTTQPSSKIETESDADFWNGLKAAVSTMIGSDGGRSVVVSPQAGIVVVRALPAELREVETFLKASQVSLQRQVVLEAKILEVTLSDGYQTGINWAALGKPGDGKTIVAGQTGGGTIFKNGVSDIATNPPGTLNPGNFTPVEGTTTSAFGGAFTLALNLHDFNAFIELLKTQGDVQVLSSPRVSTVNNQPAVIKVGSDEFFVTNVSTNTTAIGSTGTTNRNVTLTPFFSGIALDVTPQIDAQGQVILHIHPTVSEVKDQTKSFTIDNQEQTLPLALSTVRETDSIVRAGNGQLVVLGGLMQDQDRTDHAGVPLLSDIPGLGAAFRHTRHSGTKSELVILLRPVVIGQGSDWAGQVRQSSQHMDTLHLTPPGAGPAAAAH